MRMTRWAALGASLLVLLSACSTGGGSGSSGGTKPTIKIGSDGFYEAKLMAEIYAQALEANGYTVDRTAIGIGTRAVSEPALESGQFDLKPDYIGSELAFTEAPPAPSGGVAPTPVASAPTVDHGDPASVSAALGQLLGLKGITVLNYSPADDNNAFVTTQAIASQYNLKTMSDLGKVASQLKLGVATDCPTNPVCGAALKSAYGIDIANAQLLSACDTPMVQALKGGTIQVGELCSTQPDIAANNWVVLEDDKHTQPVDNVAPLVRNDLLTQLGSNADAFKQILNNVSAAMDTATLTTLGKEVEIDNQDPTTVAHNWLASKGFVSGGSPASS